MTSVSNAVDIKRVSYWPNGRRAHEPLVNEVSFSVRAGERVALVGPNGAGKTTLIRMIAGLARPSEGEILVAGRSIVAMSYAERAKHIAYVGQSDEPDGRLTIRDYVALGLIAHLSGFSAPDRDDQIDAALERSQLKAFAQRRLDKVSGGERQRAKIARAICQSPSLLILDEPTNHLDPQARGEQLALVASLGIPIITALHDLTLLDAFADKVAVLADGRLMSFGPPDEALSLATVRDTFGVDLHRLPHPNSDQLLPTLDIPLKRATTSTPY